VPETQARESRRDFKPGSLASGGLDEDLRLRAVVATSRTSRRLVLFEATNSTRSWMFCLSNRTSLAVHAKRRLNYLFSARAAPLGSFGIGVSEVSIREVPSGGQSDALPIPVSLLSQVRTGKGVNICSRTAATTITMR
jgi:hypothetical protein